MDGGEGNDQGLGQQQDFFLSLLPIVADQEQVQEAVRDAVGEVLEIPGPAHNVPADADGWGLIAWDCMEVWVGLGILHSASPSSLGSNLMMAMSLELFPTNLEIAHLLLPPDVLDVVHHQPANGLYRLTYCLLLWMVVV